MLILEEGCTHIHILQLLSHMLIYYGKLKKMHRIIGILQKKNSCLSFSQISKTNILKTLPIFL